jgi:hypothetical protein
MVQNRVHPEAINGVNRVLRTRSPFDLSCEWPMWALVLALTLLAAGLRLFLIGAKTLWLDEAFSLWVARHPLPELWSWLG